MLKRFGFLVIASVFAFGACSKEDDTTDEATDDTTDDTGGSTTVTALTDAEALAEVQNASGANCSGCHASGGTGATYAVYDFSTAAKFLETCKSPTTGTTTKKMSEVTATMPSGSASTYWETETGKKLLQWAKDKGC